ncbi:single-stranded-DNA-specific exonuclease RecJ [bacterium]|nr:single-stranded-DNA-specific exonuclease RecJ [bacterium]
MQKEWHLSKENSGKNLVEKLLISRGITDKKEIQEFINPLEIKTTSPNAFTEMQTAVERISKAIDNNECILVYGDFDADGVTSTSLMYRTFKELGANVETYIPDREQEGHGLCTKTLVKLMTTKRPKVIITVDCGVSDIEQVNFLNSFKIDVIITDHHEAPKDLPKALAIINPKAQNALSEELSAKEIEHLTALAGVGVAFKLAHALLIHYDKTDFIPQILPYVAVGTISDIVPLIGENRYFVTKGLNLISAGKHYGLKRLLESAGYKVEQGITAENIAFGVAPRINASGRLDSVDTALKVLTSDNNQEIEMAIISLNNFNKVRQELCEQTFIEAEEMLKKEGNNDSSIILFNPKWHVGIVGIVASKLVEKYYKPTFLMTYSEETKQVRCSARSIKGIHLYNAISANSELLDGFGGHEMAAGLAFSSEKITFEEVKKALNETIKEMSNSQNLVPFLNIDLELNSNDINLDLISTINKLQPFGASNPLPIFSMKNLTLVEKKLMGSNKNHLKLVVQDNSNNNTFNAIWWSKGDISLSAGDALDIAFCPQENTYNDQTSVQLILQDIHAENLVETEETVAPQNEIKVFDHRKKTGILKSVNDYVANSELDIRIFAETKDTIKFLNQYSALTKRIGNRDSIKDCDAVMFFEYPPSKEILDEIIETAKPKHVHLMNCEIKKINENETLKTLSGMIKFVCNNKNGVFELERSAVFLGVTQELISTAIEVFEESGIITIEDQDEDKFTISLTNNSDIIPTNQTSIYENFSNTIKDIEKFKISTLKENFTL